MIENFWGVPTSYNLSTTAPAVTAAEMMRAINKIRHSGSFITPEPSLPRWSNYAPFGGMPLMPLADLTTTTVRKRPCSNRRSVWRKWHATKIVKQPDPRCYVLNGRVLIGHPDTLAKMATALELLTRRRQVNDPPDA